MNNFRSATKPLQALLRCLLPSACNLGSVVEERFDDAGDTEAGICWDTGPVDRPEQLALGVACFIESVLVGSLQFDMKCAVQYQTGPFRPSSHGTAHLGHSVGLSVCRAPSWARRLQPSCTLRILPLRFVVGGNKEVAQ